MVNPIDFGGHCSKVKVTIVTIDKCGVRGDATLCVAIFIYRIEESPLKYRNSFKKFCPDLWELFLYIGCVVMLYSVCNSVLLTNNAQFLKIEW